MNFIKRIYEIRRIKRRIRTAQTNLFVFNGLLHDAKRIKGQEENIKSFNESISQNIDDMEELVFQLQQITNQ